VCTECIHIADTQVHPCEGSAECCVVRITCWWAGWAWWGAGGCRVDVRHYVCVPGEATAEAGAGAGPGSVALAVVLARAGVGAQRVVGFIPREALRPTHGAAICTAVHMRFGWVLVLSCGMYEARTAMAWHHQGRTCCVRLGMLALRLSWITVARGLIRLMPRAVDGMQ
jgi:hypothetical protein